MTIVKGFKVGDRVKFHGVFKGQGLRGNATALIGKEGAVTAVHPGSQCVTATMDDGSKAEAYYAERFEHIAPVRQPFTVYRSGLLSVGSFTTAADARAFIERDGLADYSYSIRETVEHGTFKVTDAPTTSVVRTVEAV